MKKYKSIYRVIQHAYNADSTMLQIFNSKLRPAEPSQLESVIIPTRNEKEKEGEGV
jgi:hypothetical protein